MNEKRTPQPDSSDYSARRFQELQKRIRLRVDELAGVGETPTSLATRHGLGRDFIRDIIRDNPRKHSVRSTQLHKLAAALDVDEEYLTLKQAVPRRGLGIEQPGGLIQFGGVVEAGVWRTTPAVITIPKIPAVSVPGAAIDVVYVQGGESLARLGIRGGMLLYGETHARADEGDVVIVRRTMGGSLVEVSARHKTAAGYVTYGANGETVKDDPPQQFEERVEAVIRIAQLGLFK